MVTAGPARTGPVRAVRARVAHAGARHVAGLRRHRLRRFRGDRDLRRGGARPRHHHPARDLYRGRADRAVLCLHDLDDRRSTTSPDRIARAGGAAYRDALSRRRSRSLLGQTAGHVMEGLLVASLFACGAVVPQHPQPLPVRGRPRGPAVARPGAHPSRPSLAAGRGLGADRGHAGRDRAVCARRGGSLCRRVLLDGHVLEPRHPDAAAAGVARRHRLLLARQPRHEPLAAPGRARPERARPRGLLRA